MLEIKPLLNPSLAPYLFRVFFILSLLFGISFYPIPLFLKGMFMLLDGFIARFLGHIPKTLSPCGLEDKQRGNEVGSLNIDKDKGSFHDVLASLNLKLLLARLKKPMSNKARRMRCAPHLPRHPCRFSASNRANCRARNPVNLVCTALPSSPLG